MNIEMNHGNPLWTRVLANPQALSIYPSPFIISLSNCWGFDKECDPGEGKDSRFQTLYSLICRPRKSMKLYYSLVVSTHLKNTSQIGHLPQVEVKIENNWNHHLVLGFT